MSVCNPIVWFRFLIGCFCARAGTWLTLAIDLRVWLCARTRPLARCLDSPPSKLGGFKQPSKLGGACEQPILGSRARSPRLDLGPSRLSSKKSFKMATKKDSEVEKSEDLIQEVNVGELVNAEDPVKELILAVMKILLWEEEWALVSDMNEYHNNLSRHLLNRLSELAGQPADMARFGPSFKAGWQEWKKRGEQREESPLPCSSTP